MKYKILLVDDDADVLEFLTEELEENYTIYTASNGKSALTTLLTESIDLVISDVMMPEMDGFELCRNIKNTVSYSHIPVILLTAKNMLQSRIEGLDMGADAYIDKPFSPEHLRVQITNLFNNRARITQHFFQSPSADITSIAHSKSDQTFLEQLNQAIRSQIQDIDLDVEKLAKYMNMSRATLYRKISGISNMTPHELINTTRLKKAAELLISGNYKIFEIADEVGFQSQANFAKLFLKQFGMTPTDYAKRNK
ncbi:response regulator transcription factor [Chitinophaga niabensis]|uniref:DNA-binding response regulator, OmpR family, contains REC and winged-helix (WHTH) domain n=1 Tax=Chitinophaga niabensis TaxID=536979 RepID=A0A1N6DBU8_9BACT|nr:response regulator [Chitinophaga niabensis]SIN68271.1 DNA-binding response regulator, OmpR family, contains REC and winged-helix (wHTH) domain [Chitinophaga niabensis]